MEKRTKTSLELPAGVRASRIVSPWLDMARKASVKHSLVLCRFSALYFGLYDAGIDAARQYPTLSISFAMLHHSVSQTSLLQTHNDALGHSFSMALGKAVRFRVSSNTASAVKAARVIRSIKSRYRTQAFLFLAYHFFLTSPLHLDIFIIFFILVSNFMNRQQAFPSQLVLDGLRFLLDERRFIMP